MRPIFKSMFAAGLLIAFAVAETGPVSIGESHAGPSTHKGVEWKEIDKSKGPGSSLDQKGKVAYPVRKRPRPAGKIICRSEKTTVAGVISKSHFMQIFQHMLPDFRGCYRSARREAPIVKKEAVLRLVFSPQGKVGQSEFVSTDITDDKLKTCILDKAKKWRIPATSDGKPASVAYSLVFE